MARMPRRLVRIAGIAVFAAALSTGAYAFTAGVSVGSSSAGSGSDPVSGYSVSGVHYWQNFANPPSAIAVQFKITRDEDNGLPGTVWMKLVSSSSTWFSCFHAGSNVWYCGVPGGVPIASIDQLRVVAVN